MPRWKHAPMVVLPLALIILLATAACEEESPPASSQGGSAGARISIDKEDVNFGKVPLNREVRAVFNVKNVGTDTLTMRDVKVRLVEGC